LYWKLAFNFSGGKDKPIPNDEALAVGYEKIVLEAAKVGEDPLEVFNRDQPSKPISGDGTRDSPFVIPSNVPERYVIVNGKYCPVFTHSCWFCIFLASCTSSFVMLLARMRSRR